MGTMQFGPPGPFCKFQHGYEPDQNFLALNQCWKVMLTMQSQNFDPKVHFCTQNQQFYLPANFAYTPCTFKNGRPIQTFNILWQIFQVCLARLLDIMGLQGLNCRPWKVGGGISCAFLEQLLPSSGFVGHLYKVQVRYVRLQYKYDCQVLQNRWTETWLYSVVLLGLC